MGLLGFGQKFRTVACVFDHNLRDILIITGLGTNVFWLLRISKRNRDKQQTHL